MLEFRKKGFFSRDYFVEENRVFVGTLRRSTWRGSGEITLDGKKLTMKQKGMWKDTFTVFVEGAAILEVSQPKAMGSALVFEHDGRAFRIQDKGWPSSTLLVESGKLTVGKVTGKGAFFAKTLVDLPDDLPLALRVFIGWMAMFRWDRTAMIVVIMSASMSAAASAVSAASRIS